MSRLLPILVVLAALSVDLHAVEPVAKLELSSTHIRECDPVGIRVRLENPSDKTLTVGQSIGTGPGTLRIELLDRDANWMHVPRTSEGLVCVERIRPLEVNPQSSITEYDLLYLTRDGDFFFTYSGEREIRAGVKVGDRFRYSEPVVVTVEARSKKERELLERNHKYCGKFVAGLPYRVKSDDEVAVLKEVAEVLADCELKRQIQWQLQYSAIRKIAPSALDEELSNGKRAADGLPDLWRVPACASLGRLAHSKNRFDLIEGTLKGIDDEWDGIASLRQAIREWRESEEIAAEALTR